MNKKILGLALLAIVLFLPVVALGVDENSTATIIAVNIKQLVLTIGGIIVVIGWIIAGILYLTAAGAPDKIKIAKGAMIASLIGTVLVVIGTLGYPVIEGIINNVLNSGT